MIFILIVLFSCCLNTLINCMIIKQQLNGNYNDFLSENAKFKIDVNNVSNKTTEFLAQNNNSLLPFESTNTSLQRRVCYFANWGKNNYHLT